MLQDTRLVTADLKVPVTDSIKNLPGNVMRNAASAGMRPYRWHAHPAAQRAGQRGRGVHETADQVTKSSVQKASLKGLHMKVEEFAFFILRNIQ